MANEYLKGRDFISSAKWNYFHYFLKQLTGYNFHPSIQLHHDYPCRIADLSTKTVIWPIDVADTASSFQVDAFERSDKLFPPADRLPDNVGLHVHDVYQPFPPELIGVFDIVNLRLFLTLTTDQINKLVENAVSLLKPGGYIQWSEHDKTNLHMTKPDAALSSVATEAMIKLQQNPFPNYNSSWTHSIATIMSNHGLDVLADERLSVRKSMLSQLHELHLLGFLDIPPGLSKAVDEYRDKYMEEFKKEFSSGVLMIDGFVVVVARKKEI